MTESTDFEKLRQRRLRYIESARENEFEEGLRSLLSELYPDNAHFIYELLQNAEDALATTIEFALTHDRLIVTHDGQRPFTLKDIESITGIGNSTKKNDPTKIGKFGVGFKAVFAYTTRPEILSGPYSFAIEDLFVPQAAPGIAEPGVTTFTFPFDRDDKPASEASAEIAGALSELDEKTLLFLTHITTITYELPGGTVGIIDRTAVDEHIIRIRNAEGDEFAESEWLRLTGPASVTRTDGAPLTVAAAFRLETTKDPAPKRGRQTSESGGGDAKLAIVPVADGDVSIYFPAVKESSGLHFHIHAPFASTVARDSVRDDPDNVRLVDDIATVIAVALPRLRDEGLITDSFLDSLPNTEDPIGYPYARIRSTISESFNDLDITPVWGTGGGHAAARSLVSSPSEFRNWLDPGDLPVLFELAEIEMEQPPRWIRDRGGRAGKFLAGLDTMEFGWDELAHCLDNARDVDDPEDPFLPVWMGFLEAKSDARITDLYQLIGRGRTAYELPSVDLKKVPIIRLRRRGAAEHVTGHETYLPSGRADSVQSRVPVDLAYFDDDEDQNRANNLKAFYSAAGVKRWNETTKIEQRLAIYRDGRAPLPEGDFLARHLDDLRAFARFASSNRPTARQTFADVPFLAALQSDGSWRWVPPVHTFVDLPFRDTGLATLYPRVPLVWKGTKNYAHDRKPYPLPGIYLDVDGIADFLETVGARAGLEITQVSVTGNPLFDWSWRFANRESAYGQDVDWSIDGLDEVVASGEPDLLRTLWRTIVAAPAAKASAVYLANRTATPHSMESQLVQRLKAASWILDRNGDVKAPREMTIEDLPDDWEHPEPRSLVFKLDFGAEATRRRQKREGVTALLREEGLDEDGIEFLREVKESGLSLADMRTYVAERAARAQFPGGATADADRRAGVAALEAMAAPVHTTDIRPRTVVEGQSLASAESKAYLRGHYNDAAGTMFCQTCQKPMPFRMKDDQWYFEAVRFVNARKHVHTSNAIALCPLCAALYKYARKTKNETLRDELLSTIILDGQATVEIAVVLDSKRAKIVFTGKHAIDLQAALRAAGDER